MTGDRPEPDIEVSIWIARPPEDIWIYLMDVSNESQWRTGVNSAQWTSEPPYGVGSTGLNIIEGSGEWPWRVAEFEEARVVSWGISGGSFEGSHAGYRLAPEDAGSRMTIHTTLNTRGLMGIILPIMKRFVKRQLATDVENLKAIMEA